ncbi:large-conductance mechanosensitive channel protein MscL [Leucobacter tardus]|uniref:Large-conductance mechanosensitive channel n=1 Tax=Leucobacter tardus TaxID=501483 RepID=A0A939TMA9_9MICO|nr:large conductance mechanosensitive channel protein MscL [Leucobacter tardus]MBO2989278.1 large conductance mechanosensitive channel protein MscL [Leucobacter tardus]
MFQGFKAFLLRGNVIDLAVAVVIGAAFNTIVDRIVSSLIDPIIGMVFMADSLDTALVVDLPGGGQLAFGAVIGALINFVIIAAVVYFVFVLPMNKLRDRVAPPAAETTPSEQELLAEIRDLMRAQAARVEIDTTDRPADGTHAVPTSNDSTPNEVSADDTPRHGA